MRLSLPRLFAALPDTITAAIFLTAWVAPQIPGPASVKNLMLVMLIEFIVVHSSGFYGGIIAMTDISRLKRTLLMLGLATFYMTFILAFAYAFDSAWPIYAFGWLLLSRFVHLWTAPANAERESDRMMALWAGSGAAYVIGGIATVALPLPALGMTPDFIASMHLPGSGEWVERPQTVLAFGTFYFAVQAWMKYAMAEAPKRVTAPSPVKP